jgi:hypothetical protein
MGGCLGGSPNGLRKAGPEGAVVITNHYGGEGTVENFNFANTS